MCKMYTEENKDYIRKLTSNSKITNKELCRKFNEKFGQNRTVNAITILKARLGIITRSDFYTEEQIDYIKKIAPNETRKSLQKKFNKKFNQDRTNLGLDDLRFRHNISLKSNGKFKEGHLPGNVDEVGHERVRGGRVEVKVAMPDKWEFKHRVIWEKEHGKIPKGHVILFGDGDANNLDIDNLLCISRKELAQLNRGNLIQNSAELTKTMLNILRLNGYVNELTKEAKDEG